MALALNATEGLPIRVLRGAGGDPAFSPASGYRYDGLYYVESYWRERGRSGYGIWRFRLVKSPATNPATNPAPGAAPGSGQKYSTVQRLVRNTAVTQWVKELYDYTCQFCGERLETPSGPYAEGAHVRPLGQPHNGPDSPDNVLCLCSNDNVRLDYGVLGIDADMRLIELATGRHAAPIRLDPRHGLSADHVGYRRAMFRP